MNDYHAKREARIERLQERAAKAEAESTAAFDAAHRAVAGIPMGQPILVGHHSERRHRGALDKMARNMDKGCEALKKADELKRRAAAAASNRAISSDDPDAPEKLQEKIDALKLTQERMKAVNAAHKKFLKDPASLDKSDLPEGAKDTIRSYKSRYSWEPHPHPPYQLSNNLANIKRLERRLEDLKQATEGETAEETVGEARIVDNVEANRVQVIFPGKPSDEVRAALKQAGFRWAPSEGAWQRHRSTGALYWAREALKRTLTEAEA